MINYFMYIIQFRFESIVDKKLEKEIEKVHLYLLVKKIQEIKTC